MNIPLKQTFIATGILAAIAAMSIRPAFAEKVEAPDAKGNNQPVATAKQVEATTEAGEGEVHVDVDSPSTTDDAKPNEVKQISGGQEEKPYSRKDAYRASTNQIVLHYGDEIWGLGPLVDVLNERGYPTIAIPGGKKENVEVFIGRGKFGNYNQDDIGSGTLGSNAIDFYDRKLGNEGGARPVALAQ